MEETNSSHCLVISVVWVITGETHFSPTAFRVLRQDFCDWGGGGGGGREERALKELHSPGASGSTIPRDLSAGYMGIPNTLSAKPAPPPTLWLAPCAYFHMLWCLKAPVIRECAQKTDKVCGQGRSHKLEL